MISNSSGTDTPWSAKPFNTPAANSSPVTTELPPKDPDLAKETPASIELLLNSNDKRELGSINASGGNDKNEVQIYRINATVRGGNKCADRLL